LSLDDFKIIFRDVGNLLLIVSTLALISITVPLIFKEFSAIYPLLATSFISGIAGMGLKFIGRTESELQLTHAMAISSIAWLVIPLFGSIPYILIEGMSPLNSVFESTSGWTGTGLRRSWCNCADNYHHYTTRYQYVPPVPCRRTGR
jgi:trk system potassium uptake protein TrkH